MIKRSGEQWRALFVEQAESGLSAATFCKERKLCPKYFSLRRKQLLSDKTKPVKERPAFIQAKPKIASSQSAVRLRYRNIELVFDSASPELLASLMTKLP